MDGTRQLRIVKVKKWNVKVDRKVPQPHVDRYRPIKKYEILHRPFDLRFRGRIHKWLLTLDNKGFDYAGLLTSEQIKLIRMYFYPSRNKWLNQEDVAGSIKGLSKWNVRNVSIESLLSIWEAEHDK